jgi:CRISPR type III-B/RAMP module RAMP protein Cmr1
MGDGYYCICQLPLTVNEDKTSIPHNQWKNRGRIVLGIKASTPIFVGSGEFDVEKGKQYQCFYKKLGDFIIPGSTIKGVIRSYAEALSFSCINHNCDFDKLCYACSIFGSRNYASRVSITDSSVIDGERQILSIKERYTPKNECIGRKFYKHSTSISQGNEYVEAMGKGAKAKFTIYYKNLDYWELGLIFLSLGLSEKYPFYLKLGGGKAQGLGSIEIVLSEECKKKVQAYIEEYLEKIEKERNKDFKTLCDILNKFTKDSEILEEGKSVGDKKR